MGRTYRSHLAPIAALGLSLFIVTRPTPAVVIGNDDPSGNTTAPAGIPGWYNVGQVSGATGASGVYVGNGWVLTANHVGPAGVILFGGNTYSPADVDYGVQLTNPDHSPTDLQLFHLTSSPNLPSLFIGSESPAVNSLIYVIASGSGRTGALTSFPNPGDPSHPYQGFSQSDTGTKRWGTNETIAVDSNGAPQSGGNATAFINVSGIPIVGFFTQFYTGIHDYNAGGNGTSEAQLGPYDSGGAVFDSSGRLIGIDDGVAEQVPGKSTFGDGSAYVDLATYRQQILDITDIPEPSPVGVILLITMTALGRRTRGDDCASLRAQ